MYYFRDSYFDQQIAFGIARSAHRRRRNELSTPRRVWKAVTQLLLSFTCLLVTFMLAYMLLDVLGLEHLVELPTLEAAIETLERFSPSSVAV